MASTARARSGAHKKSRTFENDKSRVIAEEQPDGTWVLTWVSSMGDERSKPLANEAQLDEWLKTLGSKRGFKEVKRRAAPLFSDAQFAMLVISYEQWQRRGSRLYSGPEDPDFRRAFRARFGIDWQTWQRELERRGVVDEPEAVREDVIAEAEAGIAAVIEEEQRAEVVDVAHALEHAEERRKRAEEGARRMSINARGGDDAA